MATAGVDHALPAQPRELGRARSLARLGLAWHGFEAAFAIVAGAIAGSVALLGFGADSLIELGAGTTLLWRLTGPRAQSHASEHRARRLIGVSFFALAAYVATHAVYDLAAGVHPRASWAGVGLGAVTLVAMPLLAGAKARNAAALRSPAAAGESRQTMLCAYMSGALLVGLGANALAGWWWADPVAALWIAAIALREGRATWRGDGSCCVPLEG